MECLFSHQDKGNDRADDTDKGGVLFLRVSKISFVIMRGLL